jgi:type II secretory pathway pseudopilin PulG
LIRSLHTNVTGPHSRAAAAHGRRGRLRAHAFTLAEAIVVLGIIVLLVGLLIPTIGRLRQSARDVVCTGRLHDLALATTTYYAIHDRYPAPFRGTVAAMSLPGVSFTPSNLPQAIDLSLINALSSYLKYPPIGSTLAAAALPPALQSPPAEALASGRGPFASSDPSDPVYFTGFIYAARMEEWPNLLYVNGALRQTGSGGGSTTQPITFPGIMPQIGPLPPRGLPSRAIPLGIMLQPGRSAQSPASGSRAVLWADDVHLTAAPPAGYWRYVHAQRRSPPGPVPFSYLDAAGCRGQHRSYIDGSVEWIPGENLGLDPDSRVDDVTATYRLGAGYWWF